jgi:hypothetical protein
MSGSCAVERFERRYVVGAMPAFRAGLQQGIEVPCIFAGVDAVAFAGAPFEQIALASMPCRCNGSVTIVIFARQK